MLKKSTDVVKEPEVPVQEMTLEELMAEDAPPTACILAPVTRGIKWNVGCAKKPLGSTCNGVVLSGDVSALCQGQGGAIATTKCLQDGEWGQVEATC
jgi:hypothetical protein